MDKDEYKQLMLSKNRKLADIEQRIKQIEELTHNHIELRPAIYEMFAKADSVKDVYN